MAPSIPLGDRRPQVESTAWVAPTAMLLGAVTVASGASVWYGAVLRADTCIIEIGVDAAVEDNVVIHGAHQKVTIGARTILGHSCVVHGASIGEGVLIGSGAVVLDGAEIGDGAVVAAGAVVPIGARIPARTLVSGRPLSDPEQIDPASRLAHRITAGARIYRELAALHSAATADITPYESRRNGRARNGKEPS